LGVWPQPKDFESRGFAENLYVKSRCVDASLVIDGSIAYPFNDGTKGNFKNHLWKKPLQFPNNFPALMEVLPEDSLLTIKMD
jgi:NAD+ kinase